MPPQGTSGLGADKQAVQISMVHWATSCNVEYAPLTVAARLYPPRTCTLTLSVPGAHAGAINSINNTIAFVVIVIVIAIIVLVIVIAIAKPLPSPAQSPVKWTPHHRCSHRHREPQPPSISTTITFIMVVGTHLCLQLLIANNQ